jgi:ATP-dependent RNA helicase DDX35
VAATSVAARVADEMSCRLGQEVGYTIRFEDVTSEVTRIKFLTDGMLLREALLDPLLSKYSVIMIDEAHERSLSSDMLLGLLKKVRRKRPELRLIVSSATLDAEAFLNFFIKEPHAEQSTQLEEDGELGGSIGRILSVQGRMYPVDIQYLTEPCENYVEEAVFTVLKVHKTEDSGDILVFLTGRAEIETAEQLLADALLDKANHTAQPLQILPLYAGLPADQQNYIFEPTPESTRKVILSTNIAEASITVEGICYVIDCGFVKLRAFNPHTGISSLTATPVSKAAATQRAGRAGRTKAGKCFRLYTEADYEAFDEATPPEIQRSDFAPTILQLKALGVDNILRFDFFSAPPPELVIRGLELLYALGALDEYAKLTKPLGVRMAELALEPMLAKCLLSAVNFGVLNEMLSIAAMTSLQGAVWFEHEGEKKAFQIARRKFAAEEGDQITLLNVYTAFVNNGVKDARWCRENHLNFKSMAKAVSIRNQLKKYLERLGINIEQIMAQDKMRTVGGPNKAERISRCLTSGYFPHVARMQPDGTFTTVNEQTTLWAHPSSILFVRVPPLLYSNNQLIKSFRIGKRNGSFFTRLSMQGIRHIFAISRKLKRTGSRSMRQRIIKSKHGSRIQICELMQPS